MRAIFISIFATLSVLAGGRAENNFSPPALTGQTFIHDPSTVVQDGNRYYVFGTGPGIRTKSSPDLVQWAAGKPVFREHQPDARPGGDQLSVDRWRPGHHVHQRLRLQRH
jgi:hypothetical protein